MRKLFFVAIMLSVIISKAQISSYDISKYKTPDYKRNSLDFTTGSYLVNSNDRTNDSLSISSKSLTTNLKYSSKYNLKKYVGTHSIIISNSLNSQNKYQKQNFQSINEINLESLNKYYFAKKFCFVQRVEGFLDYSYHNEKDNRVNPDENYYPYKKYFNILFQITNYTGFSYGRIENVEDARLTIYILDELKKQNKLKRIPTEDEITEISEFITVEQNRRFFDSRLKKIETLSLLDSILDEKGLTENSDLIYFTSLMDMWDYGNLYERKSGFEFFIGFVHGIDFGYYTNSNSKYYDYTNSSYNISDSSYNFVDKYFFEIFPVLSINYYKPIKQNWQFSTGIGDGVFLEMGYFPDTRTYTSINISISNVFKLQYDLFYYISPKFRFSMNLNYNYNNLFKIKSITNNQTYFDIGLGLHYSIF
jgi:hypothetical protein